jgi:hypothetical protein
MDRSREEILVLSFRTFLTVASFIAVLAGIASPARAQARYDGTKPAERFSISVGGFQQDDLDTTIRLDSSSLGLGTIIQLEDLLKVDNEVTTLRVDGFFRFNPRHRLDWTYYHTNRDGTVTLLEDITIGDTEFMAGDQVYTEYDSGLFKVGWNWSFINVAKYEFYLGAGLNFRDMKFTAANTLGGGSDSESGDVLAPLPTFNFGLRYNFTGKSSLRWHYELFALEYGDYAGSFQDSTLTFQHNTFGHFGFGAGVSNYNFDVEFEDDDWRGEVTNSYFGLLIFVKAYY